MSEVNHTPAPWSIGEIYGHVEDGLCEIETKDSIICTVYTNESNRDESMADAKLIAAAPELLEALQNLVNANPSDGSWNYPAAIEKARSVIKKATQ